MQSLVHGGLGVEGEPSVNLGGNLAWDDVEDLLAELDEQVVEGGIDLLVEVLAVVLAVGDRGVDELGVLRLLGGSEDQRWVGGGILGLVLVDGRKVTGVADDDLFERMLAAVAFSKRSAGSGSVETLKVTYGAGGLQLVETVRHVSVWYVFRCE